MERKSPLILVADDEENIRLLLSELLRRWGYEVVLALDGQEALEKCRQHPVDLAILDLKMPRMSGLEVLRCLKDEKPEVMVVFLTAYGTVRDAVEAVKMGAYDYLLKPFRLEEMEVTVRKALEISQIIVENRFLRQQLAQRQRREVFIGCSHQLDELFQQVVKIAPTDYTVLITGESGTGKSLLAKIIHETSNRAKKRFFALNCAAVPENLLESELFGYEKGAFTGALTRKPGKFEVANGGTLFLDEISTMSLTMQAKLLRVLQEGEFERVGGTETIKIDVRVIAATNQNLRELVKKGKFREDLYFRLNVVPLCIPPLRERREDIPVLIQYFLEKLKSSSGMRKKISPLALQILIEYDYPGNVRELENILKHAVALAEENQIQPGDLPSDVLNGNRELEAFCPSQESTLVQLMSEFERKVLLSTLTQCNWQRSRAAKKLGISRRSLYNKLEKFQIHLPPAEGEFERKN